MGYLFLWKEKLSEEVTECPPSICIAFTPHCTRKNLTFSLVESVRFEVNLKPNCTWFLLFSLRLTLHQSELQLHLTKLSRQILALNRIKQTLSRKALYLIFCPQCLSLLISSSPLSPFFLVFTPHYKLFFCGMLSLFLILFLIVVLISSNLVVILLSLVCLGSWGCFYESLMHFFLLLRCLWVSPFQKIDYPFQGIHLATIHPTHAVKQRKEFSEILNGGGEGVSEGEAVIRGILGLVGIGGGLGRQRSIAERVSGFWKQGLEVGGGLRARGGLAGRSRGSGVWGGGGGALTFWYLSLSHISSIYVERRDAEFWGEERRKSTNHPRQNNQNHFPGCNRKECDTKDYLKITEKNSQLSTNKFKKLSFIFCFLYQGSRHSLLLPVCHMLKLSFFDLVLINLNQEIEIYLFKFSNKVFFFLKCLSCLVGFISVSLYASKLVFTGTGMCYDSIIQILKVFSTFNREGNPDLTGRFNKLGIWDPVEPQDLWKSLQEYSEKTVSVWMMTEFVVGKYRGVLKITIMYRSTTEDFWALNIFNWHSEALMGYSVRFMGYSRIRISTYTKGSELSYNILEYPIGSVVELSIFQYSLFYAFPGAMVCIEDIGSCYNYFQMIKYIFSAHISGDGTCKGKKKLGKACLRDSKPVQKASIIHKNIYFTHFFSEKSFFIMKSNVHKLNCFFSHDYPSFSTHLKYMRCDKVINIPGENFQPKDRKKPGPEQITQQETRGLSLLSHSLKEKNGQLPAADMQHAPAKLPSKLHMFAYLDFFWKSHCSVCTVTVHQRLVESILENGWSNSRSFLGLFACQLQAVEQVLFAVISPLQPVSILHTRNPALYPELNCLSQF
ncbi:hypothetical protein VP01_853g2 [Puccinia sorghi]|uniref:Uncharacterized protein n=1 Tax=Puccinia sorghi TaxID=27349 RepID=A0A0L6U917_9BASI|nr:hypothetical protein VP01_853g2 [Puccinia sorghi]